MKVTLVDSMGTDLSVARAARVSFAKSTDYETVVDKDNCLQFVLSEKDQKLITYLAKHKHVLPFRHPQITLHIKVPIFVLRQLSKHQVGMSMSEISRRYVDAPPEFYYPVWRKRAKDKKQGSTDEFPPDLDFVDGLYAQVTKSLAAAYRLMLEKEVSPEQARALLPQSLYTEVHWTGSLLSFYHVYDLRSKPDAQKEVQEIANQIDDIIKTLYPHSWEALKRYV